MYSKAGYFYNPESQREEIALESLGVRNWPGYVGSFTRNNAFGAIPAGERIVKVWSRDKSDKHGVGEQGIVLGSMRHPVAGLAYFIEWDSDPGYAVVAVEKKVARAP